jgi:hypothetical protein
MVSRSREGKSKEVFPTLTNLQRGRHRRHISKQFVLYVSVADYCLLNDSEGAAGVGCACFPAAAQSRI